MKLEQQVTSMELSKRLKELGVGQESQFYWRLSYSTSESFDKGVSLGKKGHFGDYRIEYYPKPRYSTADFKWNEMDLSKLSETEVSAFTVAELGKILEQAKPEDFVGAYITVMDFTPGQMNGLSLGIHLHNIATQPDIAGRMIVYLIENDLLPAPSERG